MKLTAIFLTVFLVQVSARSIAQVNLTVKNGSLQSAFNAINEQTGFEIFCNYEFIRKSKPVSVALKNATVEEAMQAVLKDQELVYSIKNKTIVIAEKPAPPKATISIEPAAAPLIDVRGVVRDESGKPAPGVSVQVKGTNRGTVTNANGEFVLTGIDDRSTLVFSSINLQSFEIRVTPANAGDLAITLKAKVSELADVTITSINTGYQQIPKERATGSFVLLDSTVLERRVSTGILDRIEGMASGVLFNKNITTGPTTNFISRNQATIAIRGRGTINSNPNPIIVVDNFQYDGDISTINPDDVESITILKDAAAASIWGALSGNGVIVITTKKGKLNQSPAISFNSNLTFSDRPNLYYYPRISTNDYIDIERYLYSRGFYNSTLSNPSTPITPVVSILYQRARGLISPTDSALRIEALSQIDNRQDISNYLYQNTLNQHYDIGINGGGVNSKYFFSVGFDNNQPRLTNNSYQRISVKASNTYFLLNQKIELGVDLQFQQSNTYNNNGGTGPTVSYMALVDANGKSLAAVNGIAAYRQTFVDTAGQGKLLDWNYRPLDELYNANNVTRLTDYHFNITGRYKILNGLIVAVAYNYNRGISELQNYQSQQMYYTRNLINTYTQVNFSTGAVTRPIPLGGILDRTNNNYTSNNFRANLNYSKSWDKHSMNVIAGLELRKYNSFSNSNRLYGYDPSVTTFSNVDYVGLYPNYVSKSTSVIPSNLSNAGTASNFISSYALLGYTYSGKYTLTGSVRKDESNLFGVSTNQKGVPLWSIGASWDISKENFYKISWLPYLRLRVTNGYQGNFNSSVAALTTIRYSTTLNNYGSVYSIVSNLPNPELRWEKVNQLNFGLDFSTKKNIISGTIEYYKKNGSDLIASSPLDPTVGASTFTGNTANIKANGFDISINSKNISSKKFEWTTNLIFNYAKDEVTQYLVKPSTIGTYTDDITLSPVVGKPLYSVYAYSWAGLDSKGNPQAYLDGKISSSYAAFFSSSNFDNLRYMGPVNPSVFGTLMNQFAFGQFSFSFLIGYKFGHYFRRPGLSYSSLFVLSGGTGHAEYKERWIQPGDELTTNIPSMVYPANSSRDQLYSRADILVEKADHIRLQDISLSYSFTKKQLGKLPFNSCRIYTYANNLGILWRANKSNIDPDVIPQNMYSTPPVLSFSVGIKFGF